MPKLGRKTQKLLKEGRLQIVKDRPHCHFCLECGELVTCYNRDKYNPFCFLRFYINPCRECYNYASIGYQKYRPPNMQIVNDMTSSLVKNRNRLGFLMAMALPNPNKDHIKGQLQNYAERQSMEKFNEIVSYVNAEDALADDRIYIYDKSALKRVHNTDTGEEMIVYDPEHKINDKEDTKP